MWAKTLSTPKKTMNAPKPKANPSPTRVELAANAATTAQTPTAAAAQQIHVPRDITETS
ncbi:hypothetical protein JCM12141A_31490 [Mycolicibacterium hodleri]